MWIKAIRGRPLRERFVKSVVTRYGLRSLNALPRPLQSCLNAGGTHLWLVELYRRLRKDYEVYTETSKAMIYGALIRLMLRRKAA